MNDRLWAGVDLKIQHAAFFLQELSKSIEPREQTAEYVVQVSSGAIVGNLWQQSFYARFDAFLAMTRSIPEIITCCFGYDRSPAMASWFNTLSVDEQTRRKTFSDQFKDDYSKFREHPLSSARNVVFHRAGFAPVEVRVAGFFGVLHTGGPLNPVPIAESNPNNPGPPFRQISVALSPMWSDFTIEGKPLFPECHAYLQMAGDLRKKANEICRAVHGASSLTMPPG
jgi:hypothetical protein